VGLKRLDLWPPWTHLIRLSNPWRPQVEPPSHNLDVHPSALFVRHGFQVPFAEIQTVESTHTPSQTFDIFASGAIAGYLDPSCYGCLIDERYMTGFQQTVREQFEQQAGTDGLVRLVFHRIFLVAIRTS
jgi:hypothetical protein